MCNISQHDWHFLSIAIWISIINTFHEQDNVNEELCYNNEYMYYRFISHEKQYYIKSIYDLVSIDAQMLETITRRVQAGVELSNFNYRVKMRQSYAHSRDHITICSRIFGPT